MPGGGKSEASVAVVRGGSGDRDALCRLVRSGLGQAGNKKTKPKKDEETAWFLLILG